MTSMADVAKALAVCRFDPNADRKYDGMSGGFYWSDEIPEGTPPGSSGGCVPFLVIARRSR